MISVLECGAFLLPADAENRALSAGDRGRCGEDMAAMLRGDFKLQTCESDAKREFLGVSVERC